MENEIIYREYQSKDFRSLLDITKRTWEYEKYLSKESAKLAAELDLLGYLKEHSFIYIAESDDKIIGFIIGRIVGKENDFNLDERIQRIETLIKKQKDGLFVFLFRDKMRKINKKLLKNCKYSYPAELQFFVVDENYRGMGIGKKLFEAFENYINSNDIDKFYLFTDTTCNYKFYEHCGLTRRQTKKFKMPFSKKTIAEFYLYDNIKE